MDIWVAREKSLHWLNNELVSEGKILQDGFDYLGNCVKRFDEIANSEGESEKGQFCRICSLTLAKLSYLLLSCYSLALDGLAQESGALLRPLIEAVELLVYFQQDKTRINQVLDNTLPSAGIIGKRISGDFQDLREYLNQNASHFSYKAESMRHLFDKNTKIRSIPDHSLIVFRKNLEMVNVFQVYILFEAAKCLQTIEYDENEFVDKIRGWNDMRVEISQKKKYQGVRS